MSEVLYPATTEWLKENHIDLQGDKAAEVVHDYVVEKLGKNNFKVTARLVTRDGMEFQRSFETPGLKRAGAILQVTALQDAVSKMKTTDAAFIAGFSADAQWKVVKHKGEDGQEKHRLFLFNPMEPNEYLQWQPLAVVDSWRNLWDTESQQLYLAKFDSDHTGFEFDANGMVEGSLAFAPKGIMGLIAPMIGSMGGSIPGAGGMMGKLGLTTRQAYINEVAKFSKNLDGQAAAQLQFWKEIDDPSRVTDGARRLLHLKEQLAQLDAGYIKGVSEELQRAGLTHALSGGQLQQRRQLLLDIAALEPTS